MPNLYTYFDGGTFEDFPNPYRNAPIVDALAVHPEPGSNGVGRSNLDAYEGAYSLLFLYGPAGRVADTDYKLYFALRSAFYATVLTPGKRYKVSAKVKTPSGAEGSGQLGSDGIKIVLGKDYLSTESGVVTTVLADATIYTMSNGDILRVVTVGQIKGLGWAEVSMEWVEPETGTPGYRRPFGLSIINSSSTPLVLAVPFGSEEIYNDGQLFLDNVTLEEVTECDLTFGSPAYTKTDETAVDANDGTITVNATSSHAIQYSLNGGALQSANLFENVAPGIHEITIVDLAGCELVISNIPVLEFTPAPEPEPPPPPSDGVLEINQAPINSYNLISWFAANGTADFGSIEFTNCFWDLPNAYQLNKIKYKHRPVVTNGERFSFYLNFDADYNYPNFSSLRLDLVNDYGAVSLGVGTLERVFQADGIKYFIYASVTLAGVSPGAYRLMITDTSTAEPYDVLFISQEIEVMSVTEAPAYTARFQFRCSDSIYRFLYSEIEDFYQEIRLRVNVQDGDGLDGKIEQYRAVTSGRLRNTSFDLDKFYIFETYFFDKLAHRAMEVFQAHDVIVINDKAYLVKTLYKWPKNQASNLSKGSIELYEQAFSTINRYGNASAAPGSSEAATLLGDDGGAILL